MCPWHALSQPFKWVWESMVMFQNDYHWFFIFLHMQGQVFYLIHFKTTCDIYSSWTMILSLHLMNLKIYYEIKILESNSCWNWNWKFYFNSKTPYVKPIPFRIIVSYLAGFHGNNEVYFSPAFCYFFYWRIRNIDASLSKMYEIERLGGALSFKFSLC